MERKDREKRWREKEKREGRSRENEIAFFQLHHLTD